MPLWTKFGVLDEQKQISVVLWPSISFDKYGDILTNGAVKVVNLPKGYIASLLAQCAFVMYHAFI